MFSINYTKSMQEPVAGKVDHTGDSHQKLVSSLNRGGLWSITGPAQKIFFKTEADRGSLHQMLI